MRTSELLLKVAHAIETFDEDLHCSGFAERLRQRAALLVRAAETVDNLIHLDAGDEDLNKVAIAVLTSIGELEPTT